MQKIPLSLAKPGMKLARPVERNAITVAAKGLELTESLISRLENMKVERLVVEGNPVDLDGIAGGAVYTERLARLDHLFRKQNNPWMRRVKAFLHHYFELKAAAKPQVEELDEESDGGETNGAEA